MRGQFLREVITLLLFAGLMLQSATAVAPDWWSTRSALMLDADSDDFAVANLGQLKNLARKAAQEMNDSFPGGAGTALNAMIDAWTAPPATGVSRDDYAALTLGQLKTIAKPFYDRLADVGLRPANTYPWTGTNPDDYALANLGQVKTVFAFPVPPLVQLATQTGIPSTQLLTAVQAWQNISMDQRAEDATLDDLDGDGISNLQEYLMGTPLFEPADIDGDRIPNTVEDLYPDILSKSRFADAVEDYDGDGVMNFEEIQLGLSLSAASSGRTDGLSDAQVLATHLKQILPGTVREMAQRQLWDYSIYLLTDYDEDDGLLTGHPEWQSQEDANANGLPDGWEAYIAAYVPPVIRATYNDCDGDRMPDLWEYRYQFDLRDAGDAGYALFYSVTVPQAPVAPNPTDYSPEDYTVALAQYQSALADYTFTVQTDPDLDRLCNLREYYLGSNPRLADTNGDGTADEAAVLAGNDPSGGGPNQGKEAQADDDGDGVTNAQELKLGINPSQSNAAQDQDNDGFTDVQEALAGSNIFDSGSRSGPAILASIKSYGFLYDETQPFPNGTIYKRFSGRSYNDYGVEFINISEWDPGNSSDQGDAVRGAFNTGTFGGTEQLPQQAFPQIYFGNEELYRTWVSAFTGGPYTHEGGGDATKFTIIKATIPNPPKVPWTRLYLVKKYTGSTQDYASESDMIFGDEMGIVVFSQDAEGNQSVTYQPTVADPAISNDGNSLIITPPQVDNQIISYRLTPFPLEVVIPDVAINAKTIIYDQNGTHDEDVWTDQSSNPPPNQTNENDNKAVLNRQYKKAEELKIARFRNSLFNNGIVNLSREDDAFVVRITGNEYKNKAGTVTLQAFDENGHPEGEGQTIALHWTAKPDPGLYSIPMVLVSDDVDRNGLRCYDSNGNAGNHPELAFKVSGNGSLHLQSFKIGDKESISVGGYSVPAAKISNNVPITVYVLETAKDPDRTEVFQRVDEHIKTANERLLQVGVRLNPSIKPVLRIPALKQQKIEVDPATHEKRNCVYWNVIQPAQRPADEVLLADMTPKSKASDIVIIYADVAVKGESRVKDKNGNLVGDYEHGMIRAAAWFPMTGDNTISKENRLRYENRIIVSFKDSQIFTLAHEIGHILTRRWHYGEDYPDQEEIDVIEKNIMKKGETIDFRVWKNLMRGTSPFNTITSTKRLYHSQENLIRTYLKTVPY